MRLPLEIVIYSFIKENKERERERERERHKELVVVATYFLCWERWWHSRGERLLHVIESLYFLGWWFICVRNKIVFSFPVIKLTNAPPQLKTIISLSILGARKHTFTKARDSTFILENSMLGGDEDTTQSNHS